jgi:peptidyl-prolyl cis-trans isomerase SurA
VVVDRVIAVVNDQIILRSDLDKEMGMDPRVLELDKQSGASSIAQRDKIRDELLQRLIDRDLVLSEARRFGLEVGPADERRALQSLATENGFASIKELESAVLASGSFESWEAYLVDLRRSILEAQVLQYLAPGRVTDAQVREFYRKMSRGEDARVRVVRLEYRVLNDTPKERDVAYQRAQAATKQLRTGVAPSSIDDDSKEGPTEFEVGRGDIQPVLEDRIFAAKAGQIVGPVSTGRGYVVLKVLEQLDADVLTFEEAKDRIRQQLEFEAQVKAREELMEKLRSRAHLDIRI